MSARANNFTARRGADAQLPTAIKVVLTLLFSTLFLALVVASDRHTGKPVAATQDMRDLQTEIQQ